MARVDWTLLFSGIAAFAALGSLVLLLWQFTGERRRPALELSAGEAGHSYSSDRVSVDVRFQLTNRAEAVARHWRVDFQWPTAGGSFQLQPSGGSYDGRHSTGSLGPTWQALDEADKIARGLIRSIKGGTGFHPQQQIVVPYAIHATRMRTRTGTITIRWEGTGKRTPANDSGPAIHIEPSRGQSWWRFWHRD